MPRRQQPPSIKGRLQIVLVGVVVATGCDRTEPPGSSEAGQAPTSRASAVVKDGALAAGGSRPSGMAEPAPPTIAAAGAVASTATAHQGPWLTVLQPSVAIYSEPNAERSNKLGYAQSGAKIAVTGKPKAGDKCSAGWMQVVPAG